MRKIFREFGDTGFDGSSQLPDAKRLIPGDGLGKMTRQSRVIVNVEVERAATCLLAVDRQIRNDHGHFE